MDQILRNYYGKNYDKAMENAKKKRAEMRATIVLLRNYGSPYIPFLGILWSGITTAKHIYGHKTNTQNSQNESTSDNPENWSLDFFPHHKTFRFMVLQKLGFLQISLRKIRSSKTLLTRLKVFENRGTKSVGTHG